MDSASDEKAPEAYVTHMRARGFELETLLGRGSFGSVYRANQLSLSRPVAVKFFDNPNTLDEKNRKRFDREAPLLAKVEHPAVPYVITTGEAPDGARKVPYSVMQFVRGESLDRVIERETCIEPALAVRIILDVLDALACVHRSRIVHRDVKPDNILRHGQRTWLIDFSIGISTEVVPGLTRATRRVSGWELPTMCRRSSARIRAM